MCCKSFAKASEFLFEFLFVKVSLICPQDHKAEDGEANHHHCENAGKREIIVVANSLKLWLLETQHYSNCEVKVALNEEREDLPPDEVRPELSFKPFA